MDMLRESGRRADAHVVRYTLASQLVHKGDRVIDVACGLGYGSALVYDCGLVDSILAIDSSAFAVEYGHAIFAERRPGLTFIEDDVHCIARLPRASAQVVISFETLEHIADPRKFVSEAARVLSPGGRVICSVPNQWVDETGRDPNPFHLHVFDLAKLLGLFADDFRVERVIGQTAGGGMKHDGLARFHRMDAADQILRGHALEQHGGGQFIADAVGEAHQPVGHDIVGLGIGADHAAGIADAVAHLEAGNALAHRRDHTAALNRLAVVQYAEVNKIPLRILGQQAHEAT